MINWQFIAMPHQRFSILTGESSLGSVPRTIKLPEQALLPRESEHVLHPLDAGYIRILSYFGHAPVAPVVPAVPIAPTVSPTNRLFEILISAATHFRKGFSPALKANHTDVPVIIQPEVGIAIIA